MSTIPYPEVCFAKLVGIKGICEPTGSDVKYWLDDVPGIDLTNLSKIANTTNPTGAKKGEQLIETAARFMAADVEAIYDGQYKVENTLVAGCSTCKFTSTFAAGHERGTLVKDLTQSSFRNLVIDKLVTKLNAVGTFTVVLDDGIPSNRRLITHDFEEALVEYEFTNLDYRTKQKQVRIYLLEDGVALAQLSCPSSGGGCGCSGKTHVVSDLVYSGTDNGAEVQQAYGFVPCAYIACDAQDVLCWVANSAPRMIGMALLFKAAELYFQNTLLSTRQNVVVGQNEEDKVDESKKYAKLYNDRLQGKGVRGVKDLVFGVLRNVTDDCVVCNSLNSVQWATG